MIQSLVDRTGRLGRDTAWLPIALAAVLVAFLISTLPVVYSVALIGGLLLISLTLVYPLVGLGVALLLGPFGALENIILGSSLLDSGQLVLLLTIGSWMAAGLARRRIWLAKTPINLPLGLFIFVTAVTLVSADSIPLGLREVLKWVEMGLIILLVVDTATDGGRDLRHLSSTARWLLGFLLLAGFIQAAVGVWQFGLRGTGPEHFLVLGRFYRAYGTFEQPNPFGGYMNLTALPALGIVWGLVMSRIRRWQTHDESEESDAILDPPWFWLAFAGLVAVTAGLALVFSWSRGAWLGLLAGLVVMVLFSARRWWVGFVLLVLGGTVAFGGLAGGVAAGIGPAQSIADRLLGFQDDFTFGDVRGVDINDSNYSVLERLAHWQAAMDMARDDVWTGVGFGNYEAAYPRYALINWPAALGHAHNYYLNLLAEIGVIGLIAYVILWGVIIIQSVRVMSRLDWPDRGIVLGLLAAWVALAVHHLVDKLYVNNIYLHLGAMIALLQLAALRVNGLDGKPQNTVVTANK
ncbi:MAG: O-antigen ligase family protein [Chloroflexota bacterium]